MFKMASTLVVAMALCCHLAAGSDVQRVALLIIDVQDCFLSQGSLAVADGDAVIPVINKLRTDYGDDFSLVVLSQDWHCPDHVSFASQFPGRSPFALVHLTYNSQGQLCRGGDVPADFRYAVQCTEVNHTLVQTLWPDHCIKNVTSGATSSALSDNLVRKSDDVIIKKGFKCEVDSYSAFFDNGAFSKTNLDEVLKSRGITTVFVTGLAIDYCVLYTSLDAKRLGYRTYTVLDATRGVAVTTSLQAVTQLSAAGVHVINSTDVGAALSALTGGSCLPTSFGLLLLISMGFACAALL